MPDEQEGTPEQATTAPKPEPADPTSNGDPGPIATESQFRDARPDDPGPIHTKSVALTDPQEGTHLSHRDGDDGD
jgi:hypothetical protein